MLARAEGASATATTAPESDHSGLESDFVRQTGVRTDFEAFGFQGRRGGATDASSVHVVRSFYHLPTAGTLLHSLGTMVIFFLPNSLGNLLYLFNCINF